MKVKSETVLITGGAGYIGSHTAVELLNLGYEVLIIDNLSNSYASVIDSIEKITGKRPKFFNLDLCDQSKVQSFFQENKFDSVIHFAAFKAVGESVEKPLKYYYNNIVSLNNLLEKCLDFGINNFVFSSSCSVYGEPDSLPVTEKARSKKAESPYANTKQIGEEILEDVVRVSNLKCICLRYFNPVGAHDSALIGELPIGQPNNLVPVITQTAIGKRSSMKVFGNDYPTPDGSCIRDYIHVSDVAKAHVKALEKLADTSNKEKFEIYNLGTGTGNSVLEVINMFEKVSGVKVNYELAPRRPGDVIQVFADTSKANNELNWKTEFDLEQMLASAWKWEKMISKTNG